MHRRRFLASSGILLVGLTGCSDSSNDIQDSDGDGVIDSEDYAPEDSDVQEKSDIQPTETIIDTPAPTEISTPEPTPTPTPTPASTPPQSGNTLTVDDEYWTDVSHITEYSREGLVANLAPKSPETDDSTEKLAIGLYEFPRDTVVAEKLTSSFSRDSEPSISVTFDNPDLNRGLNYHYVVGLIPDNITSMSEITREDMSLVMETDPFELAGNRGNIRRTQYENELSDDSGSDYERNNIEGAYNLSLSGRTSGERWTVYFFGMKSAHAEATNISRGRSRSEYVNYELTTGTARNLASILQNQAQSLGYTDTETVEFIIDFTQSFPYVPDDVSTGFDDYTKFIMETMPEMAGDCEDTSIMLASILQAEPFNYDTILIQPPGHMAVGIYEEQPEGYYWELDSRKYSYIETTGQGWALGDCPEEYRGQQARLHQV